MQKTQTQTNNQATREGKCVDIFYLIITTLLFIALLVFSIISYDPKNLSDLSMPRDSKGQVCQNLNTSTSFLQINGPSINDR